MNTCLGMSSNISGTLMPSVVASARKAARLAWLEVMSATRPAPSSVSSAAVLLLRAPSLQVSTVHSSTVTQCGTW